MDLAERLHALEKANDGLSEDELKEAYLTGLEDGLMPDLLAKNLGKTGRWFRKFRSENSQSFDPDFKARYEEIMRPEGFHRAAVVSQMREALVMAGLGGNVRAIEKYLAAYDVDFGFLRPAMSGGTTVNIENFKALVLPHVSNETLDRMIEEMQTVELKALEA